jgi:hypothetical protein
MKTTPIITTTTSKAGLLARYLTLLAAVTVAFGAECVYGADSVPFKGSAVGAVVSASPVPAGVLLRTLAEGEATQLGRFTREEELLLNPATGTLNGTIVFTAANGDQLSGVVAAQFTSPTTVEGTITFTGGTGRFENAAGQADAFVSSPDGVHFSVDFEGSVSSVGANKK